MRWWMILALVACTGVQQRFPDDVQAALAHSPMRRLETDRFIIYYPEPRRAEIDRFLARAERCAETLRGKALRKDWPWTEKMVIVMPDVAFNNAFVLPPLAGYEDLSVIPLQATLDFSTEFGIPPDPGYIACHELSHYAHEQQLAGMWKSLDRIFGHLYTPQLGYDAWFFEGLATHYETALSPGVGRPTWPIFTGMFAAGYAGKHVGGGDMNSFGRLSHLGHHYLVGAMFVRFLTEKYGDAGLWAAISAQARGVTGWLFTGTFKDGFGKSFSQLLDEFDIWHDYTFPARPPPAAQHRLAELGNDARYARGLDGSEAWVGEDVDLPPHLVVRDPAGREVADVGLVSVVPPRTLVAAAPLLVSGMSITADGREVWLTVIDLGATYQVPRTLRWTRERGLEQIADDLGPGAAIDPRGGVYYYCWVDGDRWSLAAYDLAKGGRRMLVEMQPGTYVLGAQVSPDGKQLVASVWDGHAFVVWVIDAATGQIARRIGGNPSSPVYDASFTSDGRVMWLGAIAGRFQVIVEGTAATDAPYAALNAREAKGTIRFMDREGWEWNLAEVAAVHGDAVAPASSDAPTVPVSPPGASTSTISDEPFSPLDHLFFPQERSPTVLATSGAFLIGAVLAGGDHLGLQRWSLAGYVQLTQPSLGTGSQLATQPGFGANVAYLNTMLAPVSLIGEYSMADWNDASYKPVANYRMRDALVAATYTYRGTLVSSIGGVYTDNFDSVFDRHVAGPQVAMQWESAQTTRYTDERLALIADLAVAYYPHDASTFTGDITDVGGTLGNVLPLPFGRRHTLHVSLRGRALIAPFDTGLLQVGGDSGLMTLWNHSSIAEAPPTFDSTRFPPNLRFVEPLRGYEDFPITTDRAALADISWRYPLIIDRGYAATFRVLPTTFVRQLDFELFGAGALDNASRRHEAVGGSLTLRIQLLRVPLVIRYQLARRLLDDNALTQLVGVGPGP
jgi:hypothetical protein